MSVSGIVTEKGRGEGSRWNPCFESGQGRISKLRRPHTSQIYYSGSLFTLSPGRIRISNVLD